MKRAALSLIRLREPSPILAALLLSLPLAALLACRKRSPPQPPAPSAVSVPSAPPADASRASLPDAAPTVATFDASTPEPTTLAEERTALYEALKSRLAVTEPELAKVREIVEKSSILGTGNPKLTVHPMTRARCREIRAQAGLDKPAPSVCEKPFMAPIYDSARGETAETAKICIDQFEFPNIPCEYPVVHVTARESALLCEAIGKRLCDAHEWEGACAGALLAEDQDYSWKYSRGTRTLYHNRDREQVWAYGKTKDHARCGTASKKNRDCEGGYQGCGSNTYPAGAFPGCVSRFGVYDQHGNAAEHMSLPMEPSELTSRGGHGYTEMKGSWFFFGTYEAHEDDCRWRAPSWHETKVMEVNSHSNYHLGFRCCMNVPGTSLPPVNRDAAAGVQEAGSPTP